MTEGQGEFTRRIIKEIYDRIGDDLEISPDYIHYEKVLKWVEEARRAFPFQSLQRNRAGTFSWKERYTSLHDIFEWFVEWFAVSGTSSKDDGVEG